MVRDSNARENAAPNVSLKSSGCFFFHLIYLQQVASSVRTPVSLLKRFRCERSPKAHTHTLIVECSQPLETLNDLDNVYVCVCDFAIHELSFFFGLCVTKETGHRTLVTGSGEL